MILKSKVNDRSSLHRQVNSNYLLRILNFSFLAVYRLWNSLRHSKQKSLNRYTNKIEELDRINICSVLAEGEEVDVLKGRDKKTSVHCTFISDIWISDSRINRQGTLINHQLFFYIDDVVLLKRNKREFKRKVESLIKSAKNYKLIRKKPIHEKYA